MGALDAEDVAVEDDERHLGARVGERSALQGVGGGAVAVDDAPVAHVIPLDRRTGQPDGEGHIIFHAVGDGLGGHAFNVGLAPGQRHRGAVAACAQVVDGRGVRHLHRYAHHTRGVVGGHLVGGIVYGGVVFGVPFREYVGHLMEHEGVRCRGVDGGTLLSFDSLAVTPEGHCIALGACRTHVLDLQGDVERLVGGHRLGEHELTRGEVAGGHGVDADGIEGDDVGVGYHAAESYLHRLPLVCVEGDDLAGPAVLCVRAVECHGHQFHETVAVVYEHVYVVVRVVVEVVERQAGVNDVGGDGYVARH